MNIKIKWEPGYYPLTKGLSFYGCIDGIRFFQINKKYSLLPMWKSHTDGPVEFKSLLGAKRAATKMIRLWLIKGMLTDIFFTDREQD